MDKIKSILASASGKKPGPPVPPRPSPAAVQKALEKSRNPLPSFPQVKPSIVHGRTIIYSSSTNINNEHSDHQPRFNNVACETKCFDTKSDDSPTGLIERVQNGNNARVNGNTEVKRMNEKVERGTPRVALHHKSPVPRLRSKTLETEDQKVSSISIISSPAFKLNSYAKPPMRDQKFSPNDATVKSNQNRDDELKEKLLNEMLNRSNLVEASNYHIRHKSSNLKRSSSFDVLNESFGDKTSDKKVIFHELLISELSEMRRDSLPRLSSAKSSPDISPNGNLNLFDISVRKSLTFVSLEDSGVEDEEKMDDCSSSGVGDSWDSCKEIENR